MSGRIISRARVRTAIAAHSVPSAEKPTIPHKQNERQPEQRNREGQTQQRKRERGHNGFHHNQKADVAQEFGKKQLTGINRTEQEAGQSSCVPVQG